MTSAFPISSARRARNFRSAQGLSARGTALAVISMRAVEVLFPYGPGRPRLGYWGNDGEMRFRLLRAIETELQTEGRPKRRCQLAVHIRADRLESR
jgi:hypothetical protein